MKGTTRIKLLVIDIVERMTLQQVIRIKRNGESLYTGSVISMPIKLLNKHVLKICSTDCSYYTQKVETVLQIEIE